MQKRRGKGKLPKKQPVCPVCGLSHGAAQDLACAVRVGLRDVPPSR